MGKSLSKSRFIELKESSDCSQVILSDICDVVTKGTTPTTLGEQFTSDGVNFVKIESISENGEMLSEKFAHISDNCNELLKRSQLKENDILFSIAGAIGRVAIVKKDILPANTNQALAIIRLKNSEDYDIKYITYILRSSDTARQFLSLKRGVAQVNLSLQDIKNLTIDLPSIDIQNQFIRFSDQIDKSKFILQKMIEKLELLKKSRFIELFGNDNFPKEKLKNNVEEMFIGPFGSSLKNECFVDKDKSYCMVYEQKHAIQKTIDVETRYVDEKKYNELKRFTVKSGDIIVSCRGTIGEIYAIPEGAPFGIMHPSIMKIRLNKEIYNEHFFLFFLKEYMEKAKNLALGSSVKMAIKATDLGEELFPVPSLSEQNLFVKFVNQIDKSKLILQKQLEDLVGETK